MLGEVVMTRKGPGLPPTATLGLNTLPPAEIQRSGALRGSIPVVLGVFVRGPLGEVIFVIFVRSPLCDCCSIPVVFLIVCFGFLGFLFGSP